jgi:uncharacterized lipoprotein YmbA
MKTLPPHALSLGLCLALCAGFSGCSFLKPAQSTARHYVLAPAAVPGQKPVGGSPIAVGVGQVKLPAYLFSTSFAIRRGPNEVQYLPSALWAERLDSGFQRVLAANLALELPSERIWLSAWHNSEVAAEVYVVIERFDVDATGRGQLVAQWMLVSPGGSKTLKAGTCRLTRQGPAPEKDTAGCVATLSGLAAELSHELVLALRGVTAPNQAMLLRD